jgi:hypothetical protein
MFQTKDERKIKNTHFIVNNIPPPRNHEFNDIMWKNTVEPDRQQMAKWHTYIECWIPKAMNTHTEHVILIAFTLQLWLHEYISVLGYTYYACFVYFFFLFMGFRTILDQSLFDIGKGSGFIPEVTRCEELNNCVSMCVHAGVCVSVHTHVCVCVCVCRIFDIRMF